MSATSTSVIFVCPSFVLQLFLRNRMKLDLSFMQIRGSSEPKWNLLTNFSLCSKTESCPSSLFNYKSWNMGGTNMVSLSYF